MNSQTQDNPALDFTIDQLAASGDQMFIYSTEQALKIIEAVPARVLGHVLGDMDSLYNLSRAEGDESQLETGNWKVEHYRVAVAGIAETIGGFVKIRPQARRTNFAGLDFSYFEMGDTISFTPLADDRVRPALGFMPWLTHHMVPRAPVPPFLPRSKAAVTERPAP